MKLIIPASGENLESEINAAVGTAPYFIIVDPETLEYCSIINPGASASPGDRRTGRFIAESGADVLLTGLCRPGFMEKPWITVRNITGFSGKIVDVINDYKKRINTETHLSVNTFPKPASCGCHIGMDIEKPDGCHKKWETDKSESSGTDRMETDKNIKESKKMKIAVTSKGTSLTSEVDPRFGRTQYFLIVDSDTLEFEVVENTQNLNLPQGAGIQSSKKVVDAGAEIVITGNCGPKAFKALNAAGLKIAVEFSGRVIDAVQKCKNGMLTFADNANVEGHWI